MREFLLALFRAPLRLGQGYAARGRERKHRGPGECRFCGDPVVDDSDRCAECRDMMTL